MEKNKKEKEEESKMPEVKPEKPKVATSEDDSREQESPFDFGGLPKRDLKRNLGCG